MTHRATPASMSCVLGLATALAACGGGSSPADTTPAQPATSEYTSEPVVGDVLVPPETIDTINRSLERKRNVVAHCLAVAVDNKELPKSARGKITVELSISTAGAATDVRIARASLESKSLHDCVIKQVRGIAFPTLPRVFETSYTYGFEAM